MTTGLSSTLTTIGQRIRFARTYQRNRTMREFGRAVAEREGRPKPYNEATVSRWEANLSTPEIPTLAAIASEGPIRKEWLVFNEGEAL